MPLDRSSLDHAVDSLSDVLRDLAVQIHENPELRFEEHKAAAWIADTVERHSGVRVERGTGGLATALNAEIGAGAGPTIAVLAEYDALPEIGHACGHNLIAAGAVGAFLALVRHAEDLAGTVRFIGTPAEEGGGGKIELLEANVFDGVDAAMMYHPFDRDILAHRSLACLWLDMKFVGKPSHAAVAPWDGQSALTACMDTFRLVDSQRVHFRDGVRVHGFITDGGQAVNIIPEHAACQFSVRAREQDELERVRAIVERCARGAALACGVEVEIIPRRGYRDLRSNLAMARRFGTALEELGRTARLSDERAGNGSTDMGDISHAIPSIHPCLAICDQGETMCHERRFAEFAKSKRGIDTMLVAAKAMARTIADLLEDDSLLAEVKREFAESNNVGPVT